MSLLQVDYAQGSSVPQSADGQGGPRGGPPESRNQDRQRKATLTGWRQRTAQSSHGRFIGGGCAEATSERRREEKEEG